MSLSKVSSDVSWWRNKANLLKAIYPRSQSPLFSSLGTRAKKIYLKSAYKPKFFSDDFKITCSSCWSEQFPRLSSNQTKTTIVTSTNIANAAFLIAIPYSAQLPPLRPVLSRVSCFLFGVRRSNWQPQDMNHDSYFFRFPTLLNWLHLSLNAAGFTQFSFMPSAFFILVAACRSVNSVLQKQLTEEKDNKEQILTERDRLSQVKNSDKELIFPYGWHLNRVWSGEFCVLLLRRMKPENSFFQWKLSLIKIHVWIIVTVPKMSHILDCRITSICIHILRYLCSSQAWSLYVLSLYFSRLLIVRT